MTKPPHSLIEFSFAVQLHFLPGGINPVLISSTCWPRWKRWKNRQMVRLVYQTKKDATFCFVDSPLSIKVAVLRRARRPFKAEHSACIQQRLVVLCHWYFRMQSISKTVYYSITPSLPHYVFSLVVLDLKTIQHIHCYIEFFMFKMYGPWLDLGSRNDYRPF